MREKRYTRRKRISTRKLICLSNRIAFVTLICLLILGGFHVKALASTKNSIPMEKAVMNHTGSITTEKVYYSVEIHKGDTLWEIAKTQCSNASIKEINAYVDELKAMNNIQDEHKLRSGSYLIVCEDVPVR